MTIPSTPRRAGPFTGNGATTSFPFAFKVFAPTDVKVVIANSAGVETVLVLNSDYSVTLNANQDTSPGGTVKYPISGSPLPAGSVLSIIGDLDYDQPLDLPSGGNFSPLALENQLDRTTMQIQQLAEQVGRAIKAPITDSALDITLPSAGERAGRILVFDKTTGAPEAGPLLSETQSLLAAISTADGFLTQVMDGVIARFVAGTHYTQGVTTALTLPSAPLKPNSVMVFFAGVYQESIEYTLTQPTLTTTVITFGAPIQAASVEIRYDVGRSFAELDAAVESASASAAALNEYLGTIATANMTFPLDLGLITDPVIRNRYDLGVL